MGSSCVSTHNILIKEHADITKLEDHIRRLLKCQVSIKVQAGKLDLTPRMQGQNCSFLQSSVYKRLQMTLLLKLNGIISTDERILLRITHNVTLLMHASANAIDIITNIPRTPAKRGRTL